MFQIFAQIKMENNFNRKPYAPMSNFLETLAIFFKGFFTDNSQD